MMSSGIQMNMILTLRGNKYFYGEKIILIVTLLIKGIGVISVV